ncbi:MAG TPA: Stp1/IreP family PP2C-type Ser/Thr phosphatase [Blastocatellia bacterium]|nr:Stp1/IreP family PP2C-type Ser/Thr phosphatase [Blastocatellia bacterium]
MKYDINASVVTDVGCVREINEDNGRYVRPGDPEVLEKKGVLAIVADGMGGHSAGEVASKMAVDVISRAYFENNDDVEEALTGAITEANRQIYEASLNDDNLRGMGTTCTALVLTNGTVVAAHVGDSRLYLVRNGGIYLMTEDHSAVMEMVRRGLLSIEEARTHPDKNVILRALGTNPEVEIAMWDEPFPVRAGDHFLLCSDGLYDLVTDDEIKNAVLGNDSQTACERLVGLARDRGGYDNITVGIVHLTEPVAVPEEARETREVEAVR